LDVQVDSSRAIIRQGNPALLTLLPFFLDSGREVRGTAGEDILVDQELVFVAACNERRDFAFEAAYG